jgi:OOP family OmpA-OmpF porin
MSLRKGLPVILLASVPAVANAQPVSGLYVGAGIGINKVQAETVTTQIVGTGTAQSQLGFAGVVSLGWGFGNGLRAEVEGNYRSNKFDDANDLGLADSAGGWEEKFGGMVNVLYDFNGIAPWFVPYVGAGVGYQAMRMYGVNAFSAAQGELAIANGTKGSFAYQAIAGVAFPLTSVMPGLAATVEYRFMGLAGNRTYGTLGGNGDVTLSNNYNHAVLVGLRYNFGVAPPPPPPAPAAVPAQAPARSYLVFFDWDKATLTDRARQIIAEAAANSTKVQYTRIEVNGYTDTSGTHQYNIGLSIRRANAVQAELIKDGVRASAVTIQGFGDTHLLVPTGPGVREPQNRRVEIIIR